MPRMLQPRRLLMNVSVRDVLELLTMPAHSPGLQDLSGLLELQMTCAYDQAVPSAMALERLLRQASTLTLECNQRDQVAVKLS